MTGDFQIATDAAFSLRAASAFGRRFSPSPTAGGDEEMRLAFPVEHAGWDTAGVRIRQDGAVLGGVVSRPDGMPVDERLLAATRDAVARILSVDIDGSAFPALGEGDAVVGLLQRRYPGLRPVLFHSPYEAAVWTIIGQRIRTAQAVRIREDIKRLGAAVPVGDAVLPAFPDPARLAAVAGDLPGLSERKREQLRGVAAAAAEGELDPARLRAADRDDALGSLQRLPGIGPFSAELILVRGAGDPDHFPLHERRLRHAMALAYELPEDVPVERLAAIADGWRPYRAWVALLLRAWLEEGAPDASAAGA